MTDGGHLAEPPHAAHGDGGPPGDHRVGDASQASTRRRAARRETVRQAIVASGPLGLRELAERLEAEGHPMSREELRADVRALGAIRVETPDGPMLAIPIDEDAPGANGSVAELLQAEVSADPDWRLQVGVAVVVAVFVLVALLGWLISL